MTVEYDDFMSMLESPKKTMVSVLRGVSHDKGMYNDLFIVAPRVYRERAPQYGESEPADVAEDIETMLLKTMPLLSKIESDEEDVTKEHMVVPVNRKQFLSAMFTRPEFSFVKTIFNSSAWRRNPVYRSNVNFEGYAYWNAAIFYYIAKNKVKMSAEDIGLVLRVVPFNTSTKMKCYLAPVSGGKNPHLSELSVSDYIDILISMANDLQKAINRHRERTGRRYSTRDVTPSGADEQSAEICEQIREICRGYQETATRMARKKG